MAVTQTSVRSTPGKLIFELADDGMGGTLTINNAALVAAAATQSADSPIRQLIGANLADQAAARNFALQANGEDGSEGGIAYITSRDGAGAWGVDASVAANLLQFDATGPGAADTAYLVVEALYSQGR